MDFVSAIESLANLVKLDPAHMRPFRHTVTADLDQGGVATTSELTIPRGQLGVILNIDVVSVPQIAGDYDGSKRQHFSYADGLSFQWQKDGKNITTAQDYHIWRGPTVVVVAQGKLRLVLLLANHSPALDSQFTTVRLEGVLVPATGPESKALKAISIAQL